MKQIDLGLFYCIWNNAGWRLFGALILYVHFVRSCVHTEQGRALFNRLTGDVQSKPLFLGRGARQRQSFSFCKCFLHSSLEAPFQLKSVIYWSLLFYWYMLKLIVFTKLVHGECMRAKHIFRGGFFFLCASNVLAGHNFGRRWVRDKCIVILLVYR